MFEHVPEARRAGMIRQFQAVCEHKTVLAEPGKEPRCAICDRPMPFMATGPTSDADAEHIGRHIAALVQRLEGESGAWDIMQHELALIGYQIVSDD